jgi:8-oxo-dGTP pyrophosphatase MutT (NUDIX family)
MAVIVERTAVRALIVDDDGCVLMMQVVNPSTAGPIWITPGGGLDPGEPHEDALRREVAEELGLELAPEDIGPAIWVRTVDFSWDGQAIHQDETFHLVRRPRFTPERCTDEGLDFPHRWWSAAEIETSVEQFAPDGLAARLARLLAGPPPAAPIDVSTPEGGTS